MRNVGLAFILLFNGNLFCPQEVQDWLYGAGKAESTSIASRSSYQQADHQTPYIIDRTSTGSGPTAFIYSKPLLSRIVARNKAFRCDWDDRLQRKASKRDRTTIRVPFERSELHGLNILFDRILHKRIINRLTHRHVGSLVVPTLIEPKPSRRHRLTSLPRSRRSVNSPKRVRATRWFQFQNNVSSGEEITLRIDQKSGSQDFYDFGLIFLPRRLQTNDRQDRLLDGLYCFDGHVFRFTPEGQCKNKKQRDYATKGTVVPPASSIDLQYVSH